MVTTRITEAVPITMPSPVRSDRTGFWRRACKLKLIASPMCMVSAPVCGTARKQAEHFGHRNPKVDGAHTAYAPAHIAVSPERVPGDPVAALYRPWEVVVAPTVGPRIHEQEQSEFETEDDDQYRTQALQPARTCWRHGGIGGRGTDGGRGLVAHGFGPQTAANISICRPRAS